MTRYEHVAELIEKLTSQGIELVRDGQNLTIRANSEPPKELLDELRKEKPRIINYLGGGVAPEKCPPLPRGVRLIRYEPKQPPVIIAPVSITYNVGGFIKAELEELDARLNHPVQIRAGGSVYGILARLAEVGLELDLEIPKDSK